MGVNDCIKIQKHFVTGDLYKLCTLHTQSGMQQEKNVKHQQFKIKTLVSLIYKADD